MYVCLPPVVSLPCLLPRIPQAPRKPILPRCYTVNLSIDLCALLVVRRLARGHSKTQRRPLSATHSSYPTFQPFRAFTHFPSYQTNSFICFSTFLSPGTLANKEHSAGLSLDNALLLPDFPHIPYAYTASVERNEFVSCLSNFSEIGDAREDSAGHSLNNTLLLHDFPPIPCVDTPSLARNEFVSRFLNFYSPVGSRNDNTAHSLNNALLLPDFPHIPCAYTASVARNEFVLCLSNFSELGDTRKDSAGHSLNNILLLLNFPPIPCVDTSSLALNEFVGIRLMSFQLS
jgi:hypothetical protein